MQATDLRHAIYEAHRELLPWGRDWREKAKGTAAKLDVRIRALRAEGLDDEAILAVFRRVFQYMASSTWHQENPIYTHPDTWLRESKFEKYRDGPIESAVRRCRECGEVVWGDEYVEGEAYYCSTGCMNAKYK